MHLQQRSNGQIDKNRYISCNCLGFPPFLALCNPAIAIAAIPVFALCGFDGKLAPARLRRLAIKKCGFFDRGAFSY
jgi:hypothetical protein